MKRQGTFPFTAIIGQEEMKKALVLNVVNPRLCIKGCKFHDDPNDKSNWCDECHEKYDNAAPETEELPMKVVELPVSATEDRVVGTLDIEAAIKEGKRSFETGILADANRNILYVDEINLLDDHVVDVLLDSAAMGINTVEREGISYSHPARFSLVGTMNPEEGDIRPQLLDRFALSVYVAGEKDLDKRAEVIKRRLEYEDDPDRIQHAMKLLPQVTTSNEILRMAAQISITLGVDGHRADIALIKTAETLAAVAGHTEVTKEDLREAAHLALPHRMRRRPFEEQKLDWENVDKVIDA